MDSFDSPSSSTAGTIKPIDRDAVHRICSGQVVLNLATAVKELVENSLDAGATSIEIRLKEHGQDLIEVSDNGSGVDEQNFAGLTLKYHTSKLRDFSDLLGITSFGFRGEALSSLCALSDVVIITRSSSVEHGTKLVYDQKGHLKETIKCARQVGTTVSLGNLFKTLPVRQKEFHKNVKREFNKMIQILYGYCLACEKVKFVCSNQSKNGNKSILLSTQGGSIRDNIACLFGIKQLQSLMDLKAHYPETFVDNVKEKFFSDLQSSQNSTQTNDLDVSDVKSDNELELSEESSNDAEPKVLSQKTVKNIKRPFEFVGFISSCAHGSGRSTTDRQFFYVNSRPCEHSKIMKVINDVYRQHNPNQYPFIFLDLRMRRSSVDVNVTPDKRKIFMEREKQLLEVLKFSVNKVFEHVPSTLSVENSDLSVIFQKAKNKQESKSECTPRIFTSFLSQFASKSADNVSNIMKENKVNNKRKASVLDSYISIENKSSEVNSVTSIEENEADVTITNDEDKPLNESSEKEDSTEIKSIEIKSEEVDPEEICEENMNNLKETVYLGYSKEIPLSQVVDIKEVIPVNNGNEQNETQESTPAKRSKSDVKVTQKTDDSKIVVRSRKTVGLNINIQEIQNLMLLAIDINSKKQKKLDRVKFRAQINPLFNKKCEEELKKEINKDMFPLMNIIGQFNLGFIVTRFEDDIFVIDQHATDEKYNYETLLKNTVLSSQKLVVPQSLDLSGINEKILMDNLEVFSKNGFTFEIDETAPPTKRVKLLTVPLSNNHVFGKDDVEELLFLLKDVPLDICRPSRVLSMFASRACRKSVMIGTPLNKSLMRKIVNNMGLIDHPWNCPHGRPTIRHLVNIGLMND